jgi:translation initiation factor RLI1
VIDDLRDYRFYAEDLVHPNFAASGYVWDKLIETYMKPETQAVMKQVAELQLAVNHKPFFIDSIEHQKFLQSCIRKTEALIEAHPYLALQDHLAFFKTSISK